MGSLPLASNMWQVGVLWVFCSCKPTRTMFQSTYTHSLYGTCDHNRELRDRVLWRSDEKVIAVQCKVVACCRKYGWLTLRQGGVRPHVTLHSLCCLYTAVPHLLWLVALSILTPPQPRTHSLLYPNTVLIRCINSITMYARCIRDRPGTPPLLIIM